MTEDRRELYMESSPEEVSEALYRLACHELIETVAARPWLAVFSHLDRSHQGVILFMWGASLAQNAREKTESTAMLRYREMGVYEANRTHMIDCHPEEVDTLRVIEWAVTMLTAAGEYDVNTCTALMGSAPADDNEYGEWLGTLMGVWESLTHALYQYEEARQEAIGYSPVESMWDENYKRYSAKGGQQ